MRHSVASSGFGTAMPERNLTIPFWENSLAKLWRAPSFIQHVIAGGTHSSSSLLFGYVSRSLSIFEAKNLTGTVPFWGRCGFIPDFWTLITTCLAPFDDSLQRQTCETQKQLTCRPPLGHSAGSVDAGGSFATAASPSV